jgi:hypothetical protein
MTPEQLLASYADRERVEALLDAANTAWLEAKAAYAEEHRTYKDGDLVTARRYGESGLYRIVDARVHITENDEHEQEIVLVYEAVEQKQHGGDKRKASFGHVKKVYRDLRSDQIIEKVGERKEVTNSA